MTWLFLSQAATWSMSIVLLIATPRVLSGADFGRLFVASTFVGFFELAANLGTGKHITKVIARDNSVASHYIANLVLAKVVWAIMVGAAAVGLATAIGYDGTVVSLVAIGAVNVVISSVYGVISSGLSGLQRMGGLALGAVVAKSVTTGMSLLALYSGWGTIWFASMGALGFGVQTVLCAFTFRRFIERPIRLDLSVVKDTVRSSTSFALTDAVIFIYGKIDVPLLERLSDPTTVGWYSLAYQWISVPAFFAVSVMYALFPTLSVYGTKPGPEFAAMTNKAIRLVFAAGAPVATGIALIASSGIQLFYNGRGFGPAVPVIAILSSQIPIVGVTIILYMAIAANDRQREGLIIGFLAVVLNIALNLVLIPWASDTYDNGAIGAAIATLLTEVGVLVGTFRFRAAGVLDRATTGFLLRCVLACAPMIPAVLLVGDSLPLQVAVGAAAFAIAAPLFRVVTPAEVGRAFGEMRRSTRRT